MMTDLRRLLFIGSASAATIKGGVIALTGLLASVAVGAETLSGPAASVATAPCEYTNFIMFRDHPEFRRFEEGASDSIVREVEEIFARELESVGFHRVTRDTSPWLLLRAVVQPSALRGNSISGVIEFSPVADLNRDLAMSPIQEHAPPSGVGMLVPIEAATGSEGKRLTSTVDLKRLARDQAEQQWSNVAPILFALCDWKTQLIDDGLTVELLYQKLIDRIVQIRRDRGSHDDDH